MRLNVCFLIRERTKLFIVISAELRALEYNRGELSVICTTPLVTLCFNLTNSPLGYLSEGDSDSIYRRLGVHILYVLKRATLSLNLLSHYTFYEKL